MTRRKAPPKTKAEAEAIRGEGNVQQCLYCGGWYSKHSSPRACFGCAVGLDLYIGPDGPKTLPLADGSPPAHARKPH